MPIKFFDHTADVGAHLGAPTLEALFVEAAVALTETLCDPYGVEPRLSRTVIVHAPDVNQLLVEWLSELIGRFDIEQFLAHTTSVSISEELDAADGADRYHLEATLCGEPFDQDRHEIRVAVKGITYHLLHIKRTVEGWAATVVFDI